MDAAIPAGSSRGWFGCSRVESLPWSPTVVLNRVTTRILRATRIRSCTRINLLTAATISGVKPGETAASISPVAASESSQSRKSPTVNVDNGRKATGS